MTGERAELWTAWVSRLAGSQNGHGDRTAKAPDTTGDGVIYSPTPGRHYFGCRLVELVARSGAPGERELREAERRRREADFVACLAGSWAAPLTFDLRILSHPEPDRPDRGRVTVAFLARADDINAEQARSHACRVRDLLEVFFDDCVFQTVPADDLPGLVAPFHIAEIATLTRQAVRERLDTLPPGTRRPPTGFAGPERLPRREAGRDDEIFHVMPFAPSGRSLAELFRLLLLQPSPVVISFRLRPTTLQREEDAFLGEQLARCERYMQIVLGAATGDPSTLRPALREQAALYQQAITRQRAALRARAVLMTMTIASAGSLGPEVDALGATITAVGSSVHGPLAGGVQAVAVDEGAAEAVEALEQVELVPDPCPLAPAGAERLLHLFDPCEAAAAFRLPAAGADELPGVASRYWRALPPPRAMTDHGYLIGASLERGLTYPVRVAPEDLKRSLYVVGATGTGKTTLLRTMILDAMRAGVGLAVVDPHGDLYKDLLARVPEGRRGDVVLLDPTDRDYPVGVNLLECEGEDQRHFVVQELAGILRRLVTDEYGAGQVGEFLGPVFFHHMRMNLLLVMSNRHEPGTLLDFYLVHHERDYWRRYAPPRTPDPLLERWAEHVLPKMDYTRADGDGVSMGGYVGSKFQAFVFDPALRRIFGQRRSTIDFRRVMDDGKILLVNLAKGELTDETSRFLGMIVLAKLMAAALGRARQPEPERREFHLYVDEFQSLATENFVTLLSEARKFGLSLILANQYLAQIRNPRITEAILSNVGTRVCFKLGPADAELMEREFAPTLTRANLRGLPNWRAYVAPLAHGEVLRPFSLETVPEPGPGDERVAQEVRRRSRRRYARPRAEVDQDITRSFTG